MALGDLSLNKKPSKKASFLTKKKNRKFKVRKIVKLKKIKKPPKQDSVKRFKDFAKKDSKMSLTKNPKISVSRGTSALKR